MEDQLHQLIGDIYDAATLSDMPMSILESAASITRSPIAMLDLVEPGERMSGAIYGSDESEKQRARANEFFDESPYVQRLQFARSGRATLGQRIVSLEELRHTVMFNEFLIPAHTVHLLHLAFFNETGRHGGLSLWRDLRDEPHGERELEIGHVLAAHLRRAFQFGLHFREAAAQVSRMEAAIDVLAAGCALIDARGRLIHANCEAMKILAEADALRIVRGRIMSTVPADQLKWQTLLARLDSRRAVATGSAVMLGQPDAGLILHAVPLRPTHADVWGVRLDAEPLGLVIMLQPGMRPAGSATLLRTTFGLTAAEADLAAAIVSGESLRDYGDRRGRSLHTVRTHLKAVFAKTGTNRQAELVQKLSGAGIVSERKQP